MHPARLAERMLHLAFQRGWIDAACLEDASPEMTRDPAGILDRLTEEGRLDADQLRDLEQAAGRDGGPTLDAPHEPSADSHPSGERTRPLAGSTSGSFRSWPNLGVLPEGDAFGSYQVLGILGTGGMGRVYKALDPALGRVVALKVLQRTGPDVLDRFLREARAQARVEHPFVAKVHAVGEAEGRAYIAMQFVEGASLREGLAGLPLEEQVRVLAEACEGVHAAHRLGIVHRDLKPGNILVERDPDGCPHPVVLDFGLACLPEQMEGNQSGYAFGTPRYMSPEQIQGRPLDRRTDVYSLGVTCYEVFCGRTPFEGNTVPEMLHKVLEQDPPRPTSLAPNLPRDLETIVLKALEKIPAHRYDSARALGEDLRRFLEGEPIQARTTSRLERWLKWTRRNRTLAAGMGLSLLVVLAMGLSALVLVARSRAQTRAAALFNRESERQEALLARTYAMPPHDVSGAEDQVRADLDRLRHTMATLGREAEGPGLLALGRAHRLLGDLEEAHRELTRAWEQGYRVPEVAEELGLAKAGLYRRLLMPRTGADRRERQQDLDARYRKPAIELLHVARQGSASPMPDLAQAELALTEERYEEAIRLARRARERQGWLYESYALEAEAHMQRALGASDARRHGEAEALLQEAGEALAKAREIGRSAPMVYLLEARRRTNLLRAMVDSGRAGPDDSLRAWALDACDQAERIRSGSWEAATCRALTHLSWAPRMNTLSKDPRGELKLGIEAAEQALARRPESNETLDALAFLWWRWAMADQLEGRDPREALGQARQALQKAFQDAELAHHLHHRMGLCYTTQALYDLGHGVDPEAALVEAERHFRESFRLKGVGQPLSDLLWALGIRAQRRVWTGQDPSPLLPEAEALYGECRRLIPGYFFAQTNLADLLLLRAEYRLHHSGNPEPDLARCQELGESALRESPDLPYAQVVLGRAAMLRALHRGAGAEADFETARKWFEAALAQRPRRLEFLRWPLRLRLERLRREAGWAEEPFQRLRQEIARACAWYPQDPELLLLAAEAEGEAARRGSPARRAEHERQAEALRRQAETLNGNLKRTG